MKTLLLIVCVGLIGCNSITGKFDAQVFAQHLVDDLPCLQAAAGVASVWTEAGVGPIIGLPANTPVKSADVLKAISDGRALTIPLGLLQICGPMLKNIGVDIEQLRLRVQP